MKTTVLASLTLLALGAGPAMVGCGDAIPEPRPARDPAAPDPAIAAHDPVLAARWRQSVDRHQPPQPTPPPTTCVVEGVRHQVDVDGCPKQALPEHASKLLGCPVDRILVRDLMLGREHNPTDAVFAEGCGQRAIYVQRPWSTPREWYVVSRFALDGRAP
jgi:hypothetical protein